MDRPVPGRIVRHVDFPAMEEAVQCDCAGRHGDMDHRHAGDIPGLEFLQRNPLWLLVGLACVIASCWDPDPESAEDEVELDPDLARSLQAMG